MTILWSTVLIHAVAITVAAGWQIFVACGAADLAAQQVRFADLGRDARHARRMVAGRLVGRGVGTYLLVAGIVGVTGLVVRGGGSAAAGALTPDAGTEGWLSSSTRWAPTVAAAVSFVWTFPILIAARIDRTDIIVKKSVARLIPVTPMRPEADDGFVSRHLARIASMSREADQRRSDDVAALVQQALPCMVGLAPREFRELVELTIEANGPLRHGRIHRQHARDWRRELDRLLDRQYRHDARDIYYQAVLRRLVQEEGRQMLARLVLDGKRVIDLRAVEDRDARRTQSTRRQGDIYG
jgi:hypothetical protein